MKALRPITSRVSARLRGLSAFDDAVEVVEVGDPTEWELEPIVSLPDELERLVGHSWNSTPERNLALLTARSMSQGPCRMYRVKDAVIADGTVLTKRSLQAVQTRRRRRLLTGEPERMSEAALCSTWVTERYFAHWLHDGLTHELLAQSRGITPLTLSGVARSHEAAYRKLVDLPAHRTSFAAIGDLWLLDDGEFSRSRATRLNELVRRIRAHFPAQGPDYVFIARGSQGVGRILGNELAIAEALAQRGFDILRPEELAPDEIARRLMNAKMVVAVEGSALGHALMSVPRGCGFLMIMGPSDFNLHYRPYAAGRGIRLAYTIGDVVAGETFTQPIDRLLRTIDLFDAAL